MQDATKSWLPLQCRSSDCLCEKAVTQINKGHFKIILIIKYIRTILKTRFQLGELIFHALYNANYNVNSYEIK